MQYELRYQVIDQKRQTYQNLIERYGDEPASRYLEGTVDLQPKENFHYRPTWAQDRELYDERFSALRLTDPEGFLDSRQYYYTPYVTGRAALHDGFGKTLAYLEKRDLLARMPPAWQTVLATVVVPLRHFESGAQLVTVAGARFAYGTAIGQCCTFAAFDRIGNAQMLSRAGIALAGGAGDILVAGKQEWLTGEHLQPLRSLVEHIMLAGDWAEGVLAIDLVDRLLYPMLYAGLDDAALLGGGGAYSMLAQHFTAWYADQRIWLDALLAAWLADADNDADNADAVRRILDTWLPLASGAARAVAAAIDAELDGARATAQVAAAADQLSSLVGSAT